LLATDDFTHASSALGEIRAYGALLETWMKVHAGPKVPYSPASPEFGVDAGDGMVIVEVHTRQLDESEAESLAAHENALQAAAEKTRRESPTAPAVTIGETEVFPTGAPDPRKIDDTWVTNTISRIAAIKAKETQIDPDRPFVLWLDLHDPTVWGLPLAPEYLRPLFAVGPEGQVNSGPLWFALYGKKGCPLIYSQSYDYRWLPMAHNGRFYQTMKSHGGPTRLSAVVYSLPNATVLMENPNAQHPLPSRFRAALLKAPDFRPELSVIDWKPKLVARLIALEHETIDAAADELNRFDAAGN
jgi:hypothetical protein